MQQNKLLNQLTLTRKFSSVLENHMSLYYHVRVSFLNILTLNIVYNGTEIKQYAKVKYLGCILDQRLSGEPMALNVIDKANLHLKFLHRQNPGVDPGLILGCCKILQKKIENRNDITMQKNYRFSKNQESMVLITVGV